jgi:gluconokinase/shikimate kinase
MATMAHRKLAFRPVVLVVMGVSGSGKTTIGSMLAASLGWPFKEGDDLHPRANLEKMKAGIPLTDQDRRPWLELIADWVGQHLDAAESGVVTCSALKRVYRDLIDRRRHGVVFIFLDGPQATIADRLDSRHGHFMPPQLLRSQFDDLEPPATEEPAIRFDIQTSPQLIVDEVIDVLGLKDRTH